MRCARDFPFRAGAEVGRDFWPHGGSHGGHRAVSIGIGPGDRPPEGGLVSQPPEASTFKAACNGRKERTVPRRGAGFRLLAGRSHLTAHAAPGVTRRGMSVAACRAGRDPIPWNARTPSGPALSRCGCLAATGAL